MNLKGFSVSSPLRIAPARAGFALSGMMALAIAPAHAIEFELMDGDVMGSLDTTLSYGAMWRVQGQDHSNDGINGNDGNRNYDTGLVSQVYKITSDLEMNWDSFGLFVRGTAFYDAEMKGSTDYGKSFWQATQPSQAQGEGKQPNRFTKKAREISGKSAEILDAYIYGSWDINETPIDARFGKQVLSWGEGIFYRNGINTTNPIDAAKFRLPGSELKEALIPVETFSLSVGLTDNLSADVFYQWNFRKTEIDPVGTFFAETDLFAKGGNTAYNETPASLFALKSLMTAPVGAGPGGSGVGIVQQYFEADAFKVASIGKDFNADDDGQFGLSFRYIAEELNDTEFGFYFVNYHNKEPVIYAGIDNDYYGFTGQGKNGSTTLANVFQTVAVGVNAGNGGSTTYTATDVQTAIGKAAAGVSLTADEQSMVSGAGGITAVDLGNSLTGNRKYLEDIRVYGFSFSTTYGNTSYAGEISYRPNMPITISATDDLIGDALGQAINLSLGQNATVAGQGVNYASMRTLNNYERVESWNLSLSAIHNFGPVISFDSLFGIVEVSSEHIAGSSLKYTAHDGQVRKYAGRGDCEYASFAEGECNEGDQISKNAWGYTAVLAGTWNDVYAGVTLNPYLRWSQDVNGNSHRTGNFLEGANSMTVGMTAQYLDIEAEVQYTEFTGPSTYSQRDRDNIAVGLKYSF
ncbi:DUF1302 domain-containing protein [Sansalvadorimonas sp. 2012CJ34-2]|uniref:DUF1302 domain-containing protein n=1 Tax=Parendozoicomonas callyspongiae TaxID=2942213 RepID=A0ABT0PL71_9GAMM|nr:DUF1302 domain-containing protein [Sansalvadorimonas sp. 2012CJ34-2]MCL6272093.1 DUF1302 domain-containing protein [Sansalvadorimonas sp. 2012CJ34-2]